MKFQILIQTIRPPFLLLVPAVLVLTVGLASWQGHDIDPLLALEIFFASLLGSISVNALNEYQDFVSGLDAGNTNRTPFSGGSGTLPAHPELARGTLIVSVVSLLLCIAIGLHLALTRQPLLFAFGLVGILLVIAYTRWINRMPWLCLIAPGTGFGLLMVLGGKLALTGSINWLDLLLSLTPFFLVNNLLLLNQYPDIEADARVGRRTFPIVYGVGAANRVYLLFLLLAYAPILILGASGQLPLTSLMGLIPLPLAATAWMGARRLGADIGSQPRFLAMNVAASLLTPVLLGISLMI
jgi:1,4-dihydroxy-2-naphthoate octaprenyltransferase